MPLSIESGKTYLGFDCGSCGIFMPLYGPVPGDKPHAVFDTRPEREGVCLLCGHRQAYLMAAIESRVAP